MAKVYDPIMCMMVDKPDKAHDAEGERWITMRGSHVKIDGEGNAVAGNERVKNIINSGKAGASKESSASENNKQNANKSKADAEKTKKVDSVMKKYGERHSYSPTLRDMLSLSVDIGKKYDEDGIIDDDDIKQYKQKYDKLLDMHMDYDISKTTMNKINTDLVKVLKDYGFDKYQLKSLGWAYTGRDSMPALDEAIKATDGANGDKLYADVKAIYNLFSNILLTYTNEQSVQKLANEGTKKCLELAAKVKGVRDEAIKACDAVEVETSKWSFSSGKSKPSGFGNWWFKIGTEEKNFSGNWSSAKAEAIKYAKEKGISRISLMT